MESNSLPLVTIGIPTYNGSGRILRPIQSIWAQNYPNLEIIISDNCSTDNTNEVVENIRKEHPDIINIRQDTNISQIPNYDFLLRTAKGKYFMWLADDDFLEPGFLVKAVQFMEEHDDYSLASGRIQYWQGNSRDVLEHGFTFEQNSPARRVIHFYSKVIYGGIMHGLIRRTYTENVTFNYVIGMDYHFVANLVYLGKVKNFEFTGYNKHFGGISRNFRNYAKFMGESWIVGYFPHLKIAKDAFTEVFSRSLIFSNRRFFSRFALAMACAVGVLYCYYGRIFIGARVKNHVIMPITFAFKRTARKA
jgi:glycosyltransferase involved in cell wall biosynthesis